jgi:putative hemolysin
MADALSTPGDPFALHFAHSTPLRRAATVVARPILDRLLGLGELRRLYGTMRIHSPGTFEARALRALDVGFQVHAPAGAGIPAAGPVIVAANHPTGARDGLVLVEAVRQVRSDVRVATNHMLAHIPELRESCFFVDPFGGRHAAANSVSGLRAAHLWLRRGGALILFPAGEVAWQWSEHAGRTDSPWLVTLGRLANATGATVVPAFLDGSNSRLFYAAGRVHPRLRTLLLGRELLNQRGSIQRVYFGAPIRKTERPASSPEALTARCRQAVESLASTCTVQAAQIVAPVAASLLERDINELPDGAKLATSGALDVYCATADSIPHILQEIGRLREVTFRAVGEGTGRATDIDRFDAHYEHLFVWNRARREVVGAYRIARTDAVLAAHGVSGLYTRTLFHYDERMLERLGPSLELGRSFVRAEYQRSYNPLLLLWKGIGRFVARAPRYRVLYGPVSISSRYQDMSQQLLRAFLAQEHGDATLTELVRPINPPAPILPPARDAVATADVDELDALITRIEGTQGIPVLLRQYMRLNAVLLGFNVDPAFGDALDALMMVDLLRVGDAILGRYLGPDARVFLEYHERRAA